MLERAIQEYGMRLFQNSAFSAQKGHAALTSAFIEA